jgi:hypothetical protein
MDVCFLSTIVLKDNLFCPKLQVLIKDTRAHGSRRKNEVRMFLLSRSAEKLASTCDIFEKVFI